MSASLSTTSVALPFNGTTELNAYTRAAIYEFRVFNMVILSLAVFIVTVTAVLCCVSFHSRRSASAVCRAEEAEPVDAQVRRKRRGFRNPLALFQRQEPTRDNSHIYYIYSNPLPVGHQEDHPSTPQAPATHTPPTLQDYANDPESGLILDPPTFYMQL
ncbi:uncharacterized protein si:dkey-246e1.3 [Astyanax mexicanus]|uniref:Uncharacterized protein n=1 Tax=Astyanax mexicanus TaxID=7994 RepID=A0A8T2KUD8_ASTMX|nr:uncharacterized protein si:dkey-246e1.3 [Astyanax mexicanus]KAG9261312.1 hypothetical protein AMEX_G26319 [Astyanax mexicanus]